MKKTIFFASSVSVVSAMILLFVGCTKPSPNPGSETMVKIESPGPPVEIDGKKGIQIDVPGVDVKVGGGEGVKVDTPNTHVGIEGSK